MGFDGSGNFSRNYNWVNDKNSGIKIIASRMDDEFNNYANGMNQTFLRTGTVPMSGSLNMGTNTINSLGDGSASSPAIRFNTDPTTGIYLVGVGKLGISSGGVKQMEIGTTGVTFTGGVTFSTPLTDLTLTGKLAVGGSILSSARSYVSGLMTGATAQNGEYNDVTAASDVTGFLTGYVTALRTQAATFTLGTVRHFIATQGAFGAGSTVTNQYGFIADASLIGGVNNYGFYSNIAAGASRWNLYANGTANNFMAGSLGLGTNILTGFGIRNGLSITGATTAYGISNDGIIQSDVTAAAVYYRAITQTQATAFTVANVYIYLADQGTIGAGSTVTNQVGFYASAALIGGVGSNYGFFGALPAATGRWNFFAAGTANNAFAGNVRIGSTVAPTVALDVTGSANVSGVITGSSAITAGGAITAVGTLIAKASGGEGGQLSLNNVSDSAVAGFVDIDSGNNMRVATTGATNIQFLVNNAAAAQILSSKQFQVFDTFLIAGNNKGLQFTDANAAHPQFICQSDNNFCFYGTDAGGAQRPVFSVLMHSNTAGVIFSTDMQISGLFTALGGVSTPQLAIDANFIANISSSKPNIQFDAFDLLQYDRTGNAWNFIINGAGVSIINANSVYTPLGGTGGAPVEVGYKFHDSIVIAASATLTNNMLDRTVIVNCAAGQTVTLPSGMVSGATITLINVGTSFTLAQGAGTTLNWTQSSGSLATGNRTVASATCIILTTINGNGWYITSGAGGLA